MAGKRAVFLGLKKQLFRIFFMFFKKKSHNSGLTWCMRVLISGTGKWGTKKKKSMNRKYLVRFLFFMGLSCARDHGIPGGFPGKSNKPIQLISKQKR
jgi:hypothetical protein